MSPLQIEILRLHNLTGLDEGRAFEQIIFGNHGGNMNKPSSKKSFEMCLREVLDDTRRVGGWNPHDTGLYWLEEFRKSIKALAKQKGRKVSVQIWRTVSSDLDFQHGVDGFFQVSETGKKVKKEWRSFYFDITLNRNKHSSRNQNVHILHVEHFDGQSDSAAEIVLQHTHPEWF